MHTFVMSSTGVGMPLKKCRNGRPVGAQNAEGTDVSACLPDVADSSMGEMGHIPAAGNEMAGDLLRAHGGDYDESSLLDSAGCGEGLEPVGARPRSARVEGQEAQAAKALDFDIRNGWIKIDSVTLSAKAEKISAVNAKTPTDLTPMFDQVTERLERRSAGAQRRLESQIRGPGANRSPGLLYDLVHIAVRGTPGQKQVEQRSAQRIEAAERAIVDVKGAATQAALARSFGQNAINSHTSLVDYLTLLGLGTDGSFDTLVDDGERGRAPNRDELGAIMGDIEEKSHPGGGNGKFPTIAFQKDPLSGAIAEVPRAYDKVSTAQLGINRSLGRERAKLIRMKVSAESDELANINQVLNGIEQGVSVASGWTKSIGAMHTKLVELSSADNAIQVEADGGEGQQVRRAPAGGIRSPNGDMYKGGRYVPEGTRTYDPVSVVGPERLPVRVMETIRGASSANLVAKAITGSIRMFSPRIKELEAKVGAAEIAATRAELAVSFDDVKRDIAAFRDAMANFEGVLATVTQRASTLRSEASKAGSEIDAFWAAQTAGGDSARAPNGGGGAADGVEYEDAAWKTLAMARVSETDQLLGASALMLDKAAATVRDAVPFSPEDNGMEFIAEQELAKPAEAMRTLQEPLECSAERFRDWHGKLTA